MSVREKAFLFTDLAGSSQLWEKHPTAMETALADHDAILRTVVAEHGGEVFSTMGDGMAAAFDDAGAALGAAADGQRRLAGHQWGETGELHVRMAVHAGPAQWRDGDYFGPTLNRCARLMGVAHGGQILMSAAASAAAGDVGSRRDHGIHRLRDLGEPEHIYQLTAPGLRDDFPPLLTLDMRPGNLPLQSTTFVGRDAEVVEIVKELDRVRLVSLTGVGGVGKTRLAVQAAAEALPRFADGAWLCELAPVAEAAEVAHAVANALEVPVETGVAAADAIVAALVRRRLLVLLDNCEHVIDAVSDLVEVILRRCPGVVVLATSREALGVEGEAVRPIRSLDGRDAAHLFVDRARAVRPDVADVIADDPAVSDICARLDGVPLAIELAAARVASMTPTEIAARLGERFRLLTGGRRTALERHRTLRGTVDWSFDLLPSGERRVFARLAVFAGGFTLAAAEAVADDPDVDVIDALHSLTQKSMIVADLDAASGHYRYSMLETLRQYAEERLIELGEADGARARHAAHFVEFAEQARIGTQGCEERAWSLQVELEAANLRAALAWAFDRSDGVVVARIVVSLGWYAFFHQWSQFDTWSRRLVDLVGSEARMPNDLAAGALNFAAYFAWASGDNGTAMAWAAAAVAHEDISDATAADAWLALAAPRLTAGDAAGAVEADRRAVDFAQSAGRPWTIAMFQAHLAFTLAAANARAAAVETAQQALDLARRIGSPSALAYCGYALGDAVMDEDPDAAVRVLEEANEAASANDIGFMIGATRGALITARGRSAEPARAIEGYLELLDHWVAAGNVAHLRGTLRNAAELLARLGRPDIAVTVYAAMRVRGVEPPPGSPEAQRRDAAFTTARATLGAEYEAVVAGALRLADDEVVELVRRSLEECRAATVV